MKDWKNEWLKVKNGEINSNSFFISYYYSECKAKKCIERHEFEQYFPLYFETFKYSIIEHFDKKYNIVSIINKKNEIIKFT